jgi:multidrug efflux pump subunit AcrA (membrane-fusion protein)
MGEIKDMRNQFCNPFMRQFSGVVEAADSSSISFEVAGNVREVRVDVGDRINKGQVLAVLDKRTYNLNVKAAEAEVGRAKVKLADKRNDLDRFQRINKLSTRFNSPSPSSN